MRVTRSSVRGVGKLLLISNLRLGRLVPGDLQGDGQDGGEDNQGGEFLAHDDGGLCRFLRNPGPGVGARKKKLLAGFSRGAPRTHGRACFAATRVPSLNT